MKPVEQDIIVVGGGVVGRSIAYALTQRNHSVSIIEKDPELENSCSSGNAGMIVPSHFTTLAAPGIISQGLKWMLSPKSPFFLRPRLDLDLARWIWLFIRHSNQKHVSAHETLLRDLSLASRKLHVSLAKQEGFSLIEKGLLMLCQSQAGLDEEAEVAEAAHRLGLEAEVCSLDRIKQLEPNAHLSVKGGVWFPQDCHLNPSDFLKALRQATENSGGQFLNTKATSLIKDRQKILGVVTETGEKLRAQTTILACGTDTLELTKPLGLRLPMQGGKGYSLTLPNPRRNPELCSLLKEGRVAVTPMGDQLRIAGTMEVCGQDTSISKARLRGIIESFCSFYPEFSPSEFEALQPWVGLRPCSPDGLPYLGKVASHQNLIVATGHAMMGLSLAPITGELVAQIVSEEAPSIDFSALDPLRFG